MAEKKTIMDVSKPGKVAPDATARPVIVGHGAMIKDPMVKDAAAGSDAETVAGKEASAIDVPAKPAEAQGAAVNTTGKRLTPPTPQAPESTETEAEPVDTQPAAELIQGDNSDGSSEAIVDAIAEQAELDKKKKHSTEDDERQELVQKLVAEKTYFLPIKQAAPEGSKPIGLIVGVIVFVLIVGVYLLIDAGAVKVGFSMPFHVFKQKKAAVTQTAAPAPVAQPVVSSSPKTNTVTKSDLGISFTYPTAWGEPTTYDYRKPAGNGANKYALVTFPKFSRLSVTAMLLMPDYMSLDTTATAKTSCSMRMGIDGITTIAAIKSTNIATITKTPTTILETKQLLANDNAIVIERFGAGPLATIGCYGPNIGGYLTFKQPNQYAAVQLTTYDGNILKTGGNKAYTDLATYDAYVKDPNKIYTAQDRKDLQDFLMSFKSTTK